MTTLVEDLLKAKQAGTVETHSKPAEAHQPAVSKESPEQIVDLTAPAPVTQPAVHAEKGMTHHCHYRQLIMSDGTKVLASALGNYNAKASKELATFLAHLVSTGHATEL